MRACRNVLLFMLGTRAFQISTDNIVVTLNDHGIERIEPDTWRGPYTVSSYMQSSLPPVEINSIRNAPVSKNTSTDSIGKDPLSETAAPKKEAHDTSQKQLKMPRLESAYHEDPIESPYKEITSDLSECNILVLAHHITPEKEKKLRRKIQQKGGYLQYVYRNVFSGLSVCKLSQKEISAVLSDLSTMQISLEANAQYTLAYKQTNLPDNFYTMLNSQQRLFNIQWLDGFVNRHIRNGYLVKKSSLFKWYRNMYFPLQSNYTGKGVSIEILDADIGQIHREVEGRVEIVRMRPQHQPSAHPTSVITVAAGTKTGLAKEAEVILHPVFRYGTAYLSDILHVLDGISVSGTQKVILLPFTGNKSAILDTSLKMFYDANIPVVVAAGNSSLPACNYSPARSKYTITIGSLSDSLNPDEWSNTGDCVDAYAPGMATVGEVSESSLSVEYGQREGTSISAAYIAGYVAVLMQRKPMSVSQMRKHLQEKVSSSMLALLTGGTDNIIVPSNFIYYSILTDALIVITPVVIITWAAILYRKRAYKKDPFIKKKARPARSAG
ncbi:uncharacterized protein NESG_00846 [Nematocida ausubeli]|uniref:Peptidase S8/S53 domain-containing protein n=1 Tax=Nematocida ausubeli (strain ATCC PRA-371 / ERTm2) TaxID=1913371 RepID=A0A086J3H5_NEMA1|nr:uncharacterized protein NESG_00846 [Nematocida ausubeli]KFG26693.1 hypothetical protein NESG_00846 [Nematocida ausubeli]